MFQSAFVTMNEGVLLPPGECTVEGFAANWAKISDRSSDSVWRCWTSPPASSRRLSSPARTRVRPSTTKSPCCTRARSSSNPGQALALIEVEYEPLPVVADPEYAHTPEAPVLHPNHPTGNLLKHIKVRHGDIDD